jgi:hypothetical protein
MPEIEVANKFGVGGFDHKIVVTLRLHPLLPDEALNLAAWLVALAEPDATNTFAEVLEAVRST